MGQWAEHAQRPRGRRDLAIRSRQAPGHGDLQAGNAVAHGFQQPGQVLRRVPQAAHGQHAAGRSGAQGAVASLEAGGAMPL